MWLHRDTSEATTDWLYRDMYEVTTDELDEWADIAFADPYDPPAEKPRPTTRAVFAKMTDAIESVAHKLNSAEYKELFDAAHIMFEHCSRNDPESWSTPHFSAFPELEGFVDRVRDIRSRAGRIPPSPAMVFHRQDLLEPEPLPPTTTHALALFGAWPALGVIAPVSNPVTAPRTRMATARQEFLSHHERWSSR